MKKFLTLLLCLVFLPGLVYAQDISASLVQPGIYNGKKGQTLTYYLDFNLKQGYENRLKSFSVSLMMDEALKVSDVQAENLKKSKDWRINTSSLEGKDLVTFSVDKVSALGGRDKLRVRVQAKLKKDLKGKADLKNTYVLYFVDKEGNESSDQKDLVTTPSQVKEGLAVYPLKEGATTLEGKAPKGAKIRLLKGKTLLAEGYSSNEGQFQIVINPQAKDTQLVVEAQVKGQDTLRTNLVVQGKEKTPTNLVDTENPTKELGILRDLMTYAKTLKVEGRSLEEVNRLKALVALGDYLEVKTGVKEAEVTDLIKQLVENIQLIQPPFMKGIAKDKFSPNTAMTRAEVASVIYQIKGKKGLPYISSYKDVSQEKWYAEAIGFVEDQGYMQGVGGGRFDPNRKITKSEFAAVAAKIFTRQDPRDWVKTPQLGQGFSDVKTTHWAYSAITSLKDLGILTGDQKGLFHPDKTMTRSECATILMRGMYAPSPLVKKYGVNPFKDLKESHWAYDIILQATGNDLKQLEK